MSDEIKKPCKKCGIPKPLSEFKKDKREKDGRAGTCKTCANAAGRDSYWKNVAPQRVKIIPMTTSERAARWRKNHPDRAAQAQNDYNRSHPGRRQEWARVNPSKIRTIDERRRLKDREKVLARAAVNRAVLRGKLPPVKTHKCIRCGNQAQEYHHHRGYAKEHRLDVVPVCYSCHEILEIIS